MNGRTVNETGVEYKWWGLKITICMMLRADRGMKWNDNIGEVDDW